MSLVHLFYTLLMDFSPNHTPAQLYVAWHYLTVQSHQTIDNTYYALKWLRFVIFTTILGPYSLCWYSPIETD